MCAAVVADPLSPEQCRRAFPPGADVTSMAMRDGWMIRRLSFPYPDAETRGSLLFMGGRGDHFEKYLEAFAQWRIAGWHVESFDWRGQGGSRRIAPENNVGHIDDFGIWIDDFAQIVTDWQARTPPPHVLIGHSMGGHLLFRALSESRVVPDAAVLSAPMLGFTTPLPNTVGLAVANCMCRVGKPERAAWTVSEKPGSALRDRQSLLTHDAGRYADELWWRQTNPSLELGPASWGWLRAAYRSFVKLDSSKLVERVTVPVLTLIASNDRLVSAKAAERMVQRLPHGQHHIYGPDAAHEVLREVDPIRNDALRRIDAFLPRA